MNLENNSSNEINKPKMEPKTIIVTDVRSKRTKVIIFDSYKSLKNGK